MAWKITAEELLARYTDGERNFAGVTITSISNRLCPYLEGVNLQDINLRGADLSDWNLREINLTGAKLFGACLENVCLNDAIVRNADLRNVDLSFATLYKADFTNSILSGMKAISTTFDRAKLPRYGFERAVLIDCSFEGVIPAKYDLICRANNFIYDVTMFDGTVEQGPFFGEWKGICK